MFFSERIFWAATVWEGRPRWNFRKNTLFVRSHLRDHLREFRFSELVFSYVVGMNSSKLLPRSPKTRLKMEYDPPPHPPSPSGSNFRAYHQKIDDLQLNFWNRTFGRIGAELCPVYVPEKKNSEVSQVFFCSRLVWGHDGVVLGSFSDDLGHL